MGPGSRLRIPRSLPSARILPGGQSRSFEQDLDAYFRRGPAPIARGGFSDVYRLRTPQYGSVAIKRLRFEDSDRVHLGAMVVKEAQVLTKLEHPHILPFLGVAHTVAGICIVSPWAGNGTLSAYLQKNPEANRCELLLQVAFALEYLHMGFQETIIHGDIHLDNVLISRTGTALLNDFGLSHIVSEHRSQPSTPESFDGALGRPAYVAPELYSGSPHSWATDIFAFGMLIFHTFSGEPPFGRDQNPMATIVALHCGQRPRLNRITRQDFDEILWELTQWCWHQAPDERPRIATVVGWMSIHEAVPTARLPASETCTSRTHCPESSRIWGESSLTHPSEEQTTTMPLNVDEIFAPAPASAEQMVALLAGTDGDRPPGITTAGPETHGSCCVIKMAIHAGKCVAVKSASTEIGLAHLVREVETLRLVHHRNIQSLYGVCGRGYDLRLGTPWPDGGTLRQYMSKRQDVTSRTLLREIAAGMLYLHSRSAVKPFVVVHGDLHITNILMHEGTPLISDFGLSSIVHDQPEKSRSADMHIDPDTNMPYGHFTPMAPEVAMGCEKRTTRSDVYSFGMLMFEVYAGHGPFPDEPHAGFLALVRLCGGQRPSRADIRRREFTDNLWHLITACWVHESSQRPTMSDVYSRL